MSDIGFRLLGDNSNFRAMIDHSSNAVTKFNGVLGQIGLGISTAAILGFFKTVAEKTGAIQDLSDRLNVSTDALQSFSYVVQQAGGSSEQAVQAWDKGRKALDNLASGNEAASKQFAALGLSAKSFIGLNLEQSLELIARGYKENESAAGAYDAITDILGSKSAPALMVALQQLGTDGFGTLIDFAKQAGQVIDSETIKKIDEAGDHLASMQGKLMVGGAVILGWVTKFTEVVGQIAGNMVNAWEGLDVVPLEEKAVKAKVAMESLLPPVQQLTAEGKKQILNDLEKSRLGDSELERGERLKLLRADLTTIEEQLAKSGISQYEIDGLRLMQAETKKLIKADEKIMDADAQKHAERMEQMTAKEIQDARALLTTGEQISLLKEDEAGWMAILADKSASVAVHQNAEYELAKVRADMRPLEVAAEQERLAVLQAQQGAMETQLQTARAITTEVRRTGKGYDQQSDIALGGVEDRLKSQIQALERGEFGKYYGPGGKPKPAEQYILENELFNLQKETAERQKVRDFAGRYGEQKTRAEFGDTLTDKALRDYNDLQQRGVTAQEDIAARLAALFPKK
jgi:hypothetical protein